MSLGKKLGLSDSLLDAVKSVYEKQTSVNYTEGDVMGHRSIAEKKLDPVNQKALKKDFDDREDKDLDNDGDTDSSDKYLHRRRQAVAKAIKSKKGNVNSQKMDDVDVNPELKEMKRADQGVEKVMTPSGKTVFKKKPSKEIQVEKTLTPAEKKKREEIAQAIERENPDMPMDKKMAIATAQAKKVAEQNTGSTNKVKLRGFGPDAAKGNMGNPVARAALKPKKEENVQELSKATHDRYQKAAYTDAAKGMAKKRMGTMSAKDAYDNEKKRYAGIDRSKFLSRKMKEETELDEAMHPDHVTLHPHKTDKTKYTVGQVGKNVKGRLNPGEHISDSEVDDLHDMGMKVKHERKPFKEEADNFEKNFQKRISATVRGGKGAEYLSRKAKEYQDANPDKGKGIGPGVLDIPKARKKAAERGIRPGSLRASPNTRNPKRLPEEFELQEANAFANTGRALNDYARKSGGMDKGDFEKAAKMMYQISKADIMSKGTHLSKFSQFFRDLDTDVRDRIVMIMKQNNLMESVLNENPMEENPMMMRQLHFIKYAAEEIMEYIQTGIDTEEWYQNKLTKVHSMIKGLHAYMHGDMMYRGMDDDDDDDDMMEAKMSRQLKDPKKEMMVLDPKTKRVKVIDKSEWPKHSRMGFTVAEQTNEEVQMDESSKIASKFGIHQSLLDAVRQVTAPVQQEQVQEVEEESVEEAVGSRPQDKTAGEANPVMQGSSGEHKCAKQIAHEEYGIGKPIFGQHAEPDRYGNVAWYDVMFDHGIEQGVPVTEMRILDEESHMNHTKKKK